MSLQEPNNNFKWPVSVEREIAVPAQDLWSVISRPGNLELCHLFCVSNPVRVWPGPSSQDEVHCLSGLVCERQFRRWIEGVGYDLEIGRSGGGKSLVFWRLTPIGDHCCTLRKTVCPHALQNLPTIIRWIPCVLRLHLLLRKYLDSVVRGFEWHINHSEPMAISWCQLKNNLEFVDV